MTVDTAIARFRRRQADLFRDEGTLSRRATVESGTLDAVTGVLTAAATTHVYSGPCLVRAFTWEGTDVDAGDIEVRLRRARVKFPVDTDVRRDDIFVPTMSTWDDSMVGVAFRVTDAFRDGWQIARVAIVEEIT